MRGIELTFAKQIQTGTDEMNNPIYSTIDIAVADCLIAPIIEPSNAREHQAMTQSRDQVRIHLPKAFQGDISGSEVSYAGKTFRVDSDSVSFMNENTPTRWNRYFRAEFISQNNVSGSFLDNGFISESGNNFFVSENHHYYFAQEMVS